MPKTEPPIGTRAEFVQTVEKQHTLQNFLERLPPVLSTPNMIGWMEAACFHATEPFCAEGETTVGTAIHVKHRTPTGIGDTVRSTAVLEKIEGRWYIFKVESWNSERLIGDGHVYRAFVDAGAFTKKTGK